MRSLEAEESLVRQFYYYVPPTYDIPQDAEISQEEQNFEEQYAERYPERGPPMWTAGGWLPKPDADEKRYEQATRRDRTRKRPLEPTSGNASKRIKSSPDSNISFSVDLHENVYKCPYITDPAARISQCVRVLCGNNGVLVDDFISLYVAQTGIPKVIDTVLKLLSPSFFYLLEVPRLNRAVAVSEILEPLDIDASSKCVYLAHVTLPANSGFWDSFRHLFAEGSLDTSQIHNIMYAGSAASEENATRNRVRKQHENEAYRRSNPSVFYSAFDEPGATHAWFRIGVAENGENRAAIRIAEAVAIACLHTYISPVYTEMLKAYGVVEQPARAFGLNRTGAMKDHIHSQRSYTDSAMQRVLHQKTLEEYGGPVWSFDTMPDTVQNWLSVEGCDRATILALIEAQSTSLTNAVYSVMCRSNGLASGSGRRELMIQHALAGGFFNITTAKTKDKYSISQVSFLNQKLTLPATLLRQGKISPNGKVKVDFPIFECRNSNCYAVDALDSDPGCCLGICISGNHDGEDWSVWLQTPGEKAAKRANTLFDWLSDTGMAKSEHRIARRCYTIGAKGEAGRDSAVREYT